ncbi:hypothetical protein [Algoriphagus mannitolivorans]|uniref:hypothetical protein n=1 Tax=Algoriphagus mannitolivorans TaxID=226504 RepID=UPI00040524C6|nr:hypothetical protein [Algoriphagus mannitolivorans]
MKTLARHIKSIETQLAINKWLKGFLLALILGVLATLVGIHEGIRLGIIGIGAGAFLWLFGGLKSQRKEALQLIHQKAGNLEFSLELLEKPSLSLAEKLQSDRISKQIPPKIWVFYSGLWPFLLGLALVYASFLAIDQFNYGGTEPNSKNQVELAELGLQADEEVVLLQKSKVQIQSPSYTGIPISTQEDLEIKAIRGSLLTWDLDFRANEDLEVFLVNSAGEKLRFTNTGSSFQLKEELLSSGVYSILAQRDSLKVYQSDFYTLESIEDKSPEILPEEKETYRFFFPGNNPKIQLQAQIKDDFKVQEVVLVATLARGKGENVKFRETRFPVENQAFTSKTSRFTLDVSAMEFQPGDELYYYWAAMDNKSPDPNFSRTDTYFIKYFDEKEDNGAAMEGMAIQVLPEYFRSQRQIIIDTEKLLAEKSKKSTKDFNFTSNEIGYDQKLLRLRYGQYLGEEFESEAGGSIEEAEDGDLLRGYMHLHDQEGEHDPDFKPAEPAHTHAEESPSSQGGGGIESLLMEYIHGHDSAEENTYFEQSTRGALKAALEQMWQAELYLRLFEPEKSLPFQYKALEMLKTVQQKSRVYIKRTGYDPPPIKEEEKRLSGKLEDLEKQIVKDRVVLDQQIQPLASKALGYLNQTSLGTEEKSNLRKLAELWTQRMQNTQLDDWNLLLYLQQWEAGKLDSKGKNYLREKLYPLAKNYKNPSASYLGNEALINAFRKNLR